MLLQVNMFLINLRLKKMCDKASDKFHFVFHSVSNQYKTQGIFDKIVSDDLFKLKHCHDRYKIQEMGNKVIDDCLLALKFVHDWFVTSKTIKKPLTALYADDNTIF